MVVIVTNKCRARALATHTMVSCDSMLEDSDKKRITAKQLDMWVQDVELVSNTNAAEIVTANANAIALAFAVVIAIARIGATTSAIASAIASAVRCSALAI